MIKNPLLLNPFCHHQGCTLSKRIFVIFFLLLLCGRNIAQPVISGTVYDDLNGGTINGTATNVIGSNTMYASLLSNSTGRVLASVAVASNGTYMFTSANGLVAGTIFRVAVSNGVQTVNTVPNTSLINAVNTAEGTTAAGDNVPDGIVFNITATSGTVGNVNFGIDQLPTANNVSSTSQQNPNGNGKVVVPALYGRDPEQGSFSAVAGRDTVKIITLPSSGTLYYNNLAVTAGQVIYNYDPNLLAVDPADGNQTISFTYAELDAALQASPPATVTMPFTSPVPLTCSNGQMYIYQSDILATMNPNTQVATTIATLGSSLNALAFNPADSMVWLNASNSLFRVDAGGVVTGFTVPNFNPAAFSGGNLPAKGAINGDGYYFIDRSQAEANKKYYTIDLNPAHSTYLQIVNPANNYALATPPYCRVASDSLRLTHDWAWNSADKKLYSVVSTGFNGGKIQILEPVTGTVSIGVTSQLPDGRSVPTGSVYGSQVLDANGKLLALVNSGNDIYGIDIATGEAVLVSNGSNSTSGSDAGSCPTSILTYFITGNVYHDINGLTDNILNGGLANTGTKLYVALYNNTTGRVDLYDSVRTNGKYGMGCTPNNNFSIYLTSTQPVIGSTAIPTLTLPAGWAFVGEHVGAGSGGDGLANGILPFGAVNNDKTFSNFGIEQMPAANNATTMPQSNFNPYTQTVASTSFSGMDFSGGTVQNIRITAFPTNAQTIVVNGVTYTNTGFPPGGITIPANTSGNPLQTIQVKPSYGATSVVIPYSTVDNAGVLSATANVTIPYYTILPATGMQLSARRSGQDVQLTWYTLTEQNTRCFRIERSYDGRSFTAIDTLNAAGNSNGRKNYTYTDYNITEAVVYYRVHLLDADGRLTITNTVAVRLNRISNHSHIFPNPVTEMLFVELEKAGHYSLELYNAAGQQLINRAITSVSAGSVTGIDRGSLAAGSYLLKVINRDTQESETIKVIFR